MMTRRFALRDDPWERIKDLIARAKMDCRDDGSHTIDSLSKWFCTATEQAFRD